jgi:hypothetical protein
MIPTDFLGLGGILAIWLIASYIRFRPFISKYRELIIFSYRLTDRYGDYIIRKFYVFNTKTFKFIDV